MEAPMNSLIRSAEHFDVTGLHVDDNRGEKRRLLSSAFEEESMGEFAQPPAITGKMTVHLIHPNGDPLMHQNVKIYAEGFFGLSEIANIRTNHEGTFSFSFDPEGFDETDKLILRIFEEVLPTDHILDAFRPTERTVFERKFTPNQPKKQFKIPLYEYLDEDENYLPRLRQPSDSSLKPQQETSDYKFDLVQAGADERVKDFAARFVKTPEGIENLYGVHDPSLDLNSETTVDLLLNGIYPCPLLKGSDDQTDYLVDINWDRYEVDSGPRPVLPNIKIHLKRDGNALSVTNVAVQFKGGQWSNHMSGTPGFERALYLANSMALIKGEIVSHLGLGHLYTEQNAMAVFRAINENPIGKLLKPHLRGVLEINHRGTEEIFGPEGILNVSGLNVKGITTALQDVLSGVCYSNFKPRNPTTDNHPFALAEGKYWDIITAVVDQFFVEHEADIVKHWYEIVYMSKCLVEHSLPYRPWEGVEDYGKWVDGNEVDDPTDPGRVIVNGHERAIRPITHSDPAQGPDAKDIERLKQFSRHAIFMATFWHWTVHTSQGKWGTNLKIASLAPRTPVQMPYGNVAIEDAAKQLSLAHTFTDFHRGDLVDNIHGDIYEPLIAEIIKNKQFFADLGYDIEKMPFGVII